MHADAVAETAVSQEETGVVGSPVASKTRVDPYRDWSLLVVKILALKTVPGCRLIGTRP